MPTYSVQFRRGTAIEHETFIGAQGEITVVTDDSTLRLHDGTTPGGHALAEAANILTDISQYTDVDGVLTGAAEIASGITVADDESIYGNYVEAIVASNSSGTGVDDKTGFSTITNSGVTSSNSVTKFADYSLYFDGASYLELPYSIEDPDLQFGGLKPFTIEAWMHPTNSASNGVIMAVDDSLSTRQGFSLIRKTDGTVQFNCFQNYIRTSNVFLNSTTAIADNSWAHIAVTFNGNNVKLFINGTVEDSQSINPRLYPSTQNLTIGGYAGGTGNDKFVGYMDDIRVTNGVVRYTGDFNIPTSVLTHVLPASPYSLPWGGNRGITAGRDSTVIDTFNVATSGNSITGFGDLTIGRYRYFSLSNAVRTVFTGEEQSGRMDYLVNATGGNAEILGSLQVGRRRGGGASDGTVGLFIGGEGYSDRIDKIIVDTAGDSTLFGSLYAAHYGNVTGNSTYAINWGGWANWQMQYITYATGGTATQWGTAVTTAYFGIGTVSNETYGVTCYGTNMEYCTFDTLGSVAAFGTLTAGLDEMYGGASNGTTGVFVGSSSTVGGDMKYITIDTQGNAADFGDITNTTWPATSAGNAA